jgi:putative hydrolase of the HAD superfamily
VYESIRTILLDFDGTLVFHEPDSTDLIGAFLSEIGQPMSQEAEQAVRRRRHRYFVDPDIRVQFQDLSPHEFWHHFNRHLLSTLGVEGDLDELARGVTARVTSIDFVYHCPDGGCQTLAELHARGYQLGLITNRENVERFHQILDLVELRSYFDLILASGEVGVSKPNPAIFQIALDRLGGKASQALYVGDNYWADVVGSRQAGITPVLLDPHGLFPEASCLVLNRISELLAWLP